MLSLQQNILNSIEPMGQSNSNGNQIHGCCFSTAARKRKRVPEKHNEPVQSLNTSTKIDTINPESVQRKIPQLTSIISKQSIIEHPSLVKIERSTETDCKTPQEKVELVVQTITEPNRQAIRTSKPKEEAIVQKESQLNANPSDLIDQDQRESPLSSLSSENDSKIQPMILGIQSIIKNGEEVLKRSNLLKKKENSICNSPNKPIIRNTMLKRQQRSIFKISEVDQQYELTDTENISKSFESIVMGEELKNSYSALEISTPKQVKLDPLAYTAKDRIIDARKEVKATNVL